MDNETNAASATALAENDGGSTAEDRLTAYFQAQDEPEPSQVDNSDTDDEADESTSDEQSGGDEPAEGDADDQGGDQDEQESDEESETDESNDELPKASFGGKPEFLDAAGLKAKYPRNSSNALIEEAASYSQLAKKGQEVIEAIGGEPFVPGMTTIANGMKSNDGGVILQGIQDAAGDEAVIDIIGKVAYTGIVESVEMLKSDKPFEVEFGKGMLGVVEAALSERLGREVTMAKLDRFAQLEDAGWFEKVEEWTKAGYADIDEVNSLIDDTANPKLLAVLKENAELKSQQAKEKTTAQAQSAVQQREIENSFGKEVSEAITKSLNEVVWKTSALRDIDSDSDEIKADKAMLRQNLEQLANAAFNAADKRMSLLKDYRQGKGNTAVFKTALAEVIDAAILSTEANTAKAEQLIAKLYGKSPNAKLISKAKAAANGQPPTQTKQFEKKDNASVADIDKAYADRFAAYEQG